MFNKPTSYIITFLSFSSVLSDVLSSSGFGSGNGIGMGLSMVNALPARVRRDKPLPVIPRPTTGNNGGNKARALKFRRENDAVVTAIALPTAEGVDPNENLEGNLVRRKENVVPQIPAIPVPTPPITNKSKDVKRQEDGVAKRTEPDWDSEEGKSLGRLLRDYQLLKNAIPAAPEGSGLKDGLMREVENKKQLITDKFGQPLPDEPTPTGGQPLEGNSATTVSSADGSLVTVFTLADGNIVISANGQNKTVTLGDNGMPLDSNTPEPTPTESVKSLSTSLGWVTLSTSTSASASTSPATTSPAAAASVTGKNGNGATLAGPFDLLPGTMVMKSLLTTVVGLLLGAWVAL